jgi:hypothetical protein
MIWIISFIVVTVAISTRETVGPDNRVISSYGTHESRGWRFTCDFSPTAASIQSPRWVSLPYNVFGSTALSW